MFKLHRNLYATRWTFNQDFPTKEHTVINTTCSLTYFYLGFWRVPHSPRTSTESQRIRVYRYNEDCKEHTNFWFEPFSGISFALFRPPGALTKLLQLGKKAEFCSHPRAVTVERGLVTSNTTGAFVTLWWGPLVGYGMLLLPPQIGCINVDIIHCVLEAHSTTPPTSLVSTYTFNTDQLQISPVVKLTCKSLHHHSLFYHSHS